MEMFQLRYFTAAAHNLHFTLAAEECFISQPSLSQQIAKLEREVGAPLFHRNGRAVELTDAGAALLAYAERILAEEAAARRAIQEVVGLKRGQITVWTLPTPGQHLLPAHLAKFRRNHPEIELSLRETAPAELIAEAVVASKADLGIVQLPYHVEGLCEHVLLEEEMALVVPAGHWAARCNSISLDRVSGEDFVWVSEGDSEKHPLYAACLAAGFTPRIVCLSGSAQGMQALVSAGLGIALLPRLAIHPPEGAVMVELDAPRPIRTLAVVWRPNRLTRAAESFLEMLKGES